MARTNYYALGRGQKIVDECMERRDDANPEAAFDLGDITDVLAIKTKEALQLYDAAKNADVTPAAKAAARQNFVAFTELLTSTSAKGAKIAETLPKLTSLAKVEYVASQIAKILANKVKQHVPAKVYNDIMDDICNISMPADTTTDAFIEEPDDKFL